MVICLAKVVIGEIEEVEGPKGNYKKLLVHPETTGNKYCQVSLLRISPGERFPRHLHPSSEDVIYVLRGRAIFSLGEEKVEVSAGEILVIPENVPHSAVNRTEEDLEAIVIQAPIPEFKFLEPA
ncbi:MAG: cupin domain-containing protein [Methanocellales archaeon]|nr:cupin domain-containing protein [Methanocellales archaeon]